MGRQTRLPSAWQAPVAAETNPATQPAHNPIPSIPALRQTKLWRTQESHQDDTAKSPYGDWLTPKDAAHTRFWYHNVNGISAKNDLAEAYQAALVAANQDVDILAMSETNLDWNAHIKGAFCQLVHRGHPQRVPSRGRRTGYTKRPIRPSMPTTRRRHGSLLIHGPPRERRP
jgi:hypothetical protein